MGPFRQQTGPIKQHFGLVYLLKSNAGKAIRVAMGKTLQVARDRASDNTKTVLPTEVARGVYIKNAPGLQALKLMHLMIGTAGGRMADDVTHQMRLADIRRIDGMRNHDRASLTPLFEELSAAVLTHDDPEKRIVTIGGLLDETRIDYRNEDSGDLLVSWTFRSTFRRMAAQSNHWAIIDRQTVFHLRSQYSVLLFQHVSSLVGLDRVRSKTFDLADLRAVFGLQDGKLDRFSNFNQRVLQPAIAEINQLARFFISASPVKEGRNVVGVRIEWAAKPSLTETRKELAVHSAGRKARRSGNAETVVGAPSFPPTHGVAFTPPFSTISEAAGIVTAQGSRDVADAFRAVLREKRVPLDAKNIVALFEDFVRNQWGQ